MLKPILIAGPTASGKSGLALAIAREFNGVIVNADSAQVYRELEIITARPPQRDLEMAPHRLYGHVSGAVPYSTGAWLQDVTLVLQEIKAASKRAIIVGGTGLYFQALLQGLSCVPEIAGDVRAYWRREAERLGAERLHEILTLKDPLMAAQLRVSDTQRIVRALEVIESTGRSLKYWQTEAMGPPLLALSDTLPFVLAFERAVLYERINARFSNMVHGGGLEEVRDLLKLGFDPHLPVMRALGVPELARYEANDVSLEMAIEQACQQTRRYAKRQLTWLRRNMIAWDQVFSQDMESQIPKIFAKIHDSG